MFAIQQLKALLKKVLSEQHDIKDLKLYLKRLEEMETVDFHYEINKVKEKIKLIVDVKNVVENECKLKQSVEMLEQIFTRVNELSSADANGKQIKCILSIQQGFQS